MTGRLLRIGFIIFLASCGFRAVAHEIRPAIASMTFSPDGRFEIAISANLEALIAGIGPQHGNTDDAPNAVDYNKMRAMPPADLMPRVEAFAPRWLDGIAIEFDGKRVRPALGDIHIPAVGDIALARLSTVRLSGAVPAGATSFRWQYSAEFGSSVIR
ncbi:unnamed protein product, partial [Phaeothamnion confervicola]